MSRYRGPRLRIMRSLGVELPGLGRKIPERKPYPPGQHKGSARVKRSTYGKQLLEKQKLRFNYGLSERQLRIYVRKAFSKSGNPGENLLGMLEQRLDNVVFRAGLSPSIIAARQLVSHGHVQVDGKRVNIPSYLVRAGQALTIGEKAKKIPFVVFAQEKPALVKPDWLKEEEPFRYSITAQPNAASMPLRLEISTIVEFYSRRV